jgi:hypothetical protein
MRCALRTALAIALWLATSAAHAYAQVSAEAQKAFADGRYLSAAELAEEEGSAEALAFAARARIADAITHADGLCFDCLLQAELTAEAAIERDPDLAEAYVQLAIAIGFRGRLVDPLEAQSEGLAERGRAAIDRALALDPGNAWARASLGGWHLEIVHRAGKLLAAVLYAASEEEGLSHFRTALAGDPQSLLLRYHYALSILALDQRRFREEALASLEAGAKDTRSEAMMAFVRARADALLAKLKAGTPDEIALLVRRYQGFPDQPMKAGAR